MDALYGKGLSAVDIGGATMSDAETQRLGYLSVADTDPLTRFAYQFMNANAYAGITYGKTATVFLTLEGLIGEDAMRAGPGARLELTIAANSAEGFVRAQRQFAALGKRGVLVTIQRDDALATPPLHSTADHSVEPQQVAVAGAHLTLTDPLLDQLTGTRTTVTVTTYAGDDRWQADDLIAHVGQGAKRFGDGTPVEQVDVHCSARP